MILADHCVFGSTIRLLRASGYAVTTLKQLGPTDIGDPEVLNLAARLNSLLLTNDQEFGNILLYPPARHQGVVVLKVDARTEEPVHRVLLLIYHANDPGAGDRPQRGRNPAGARDANECGSRRRRAFHGGPSVTAPLLRKSANNQNVPSRKTPDRPKQKPLTEEELDALACARIDQLIRTEKRIPLAEVLKEYGRRLPRRRPVGR